MEINLNGETHEQDAAVSTLVSTGNEPRPGSLASRMASRREAISSTTSDLFEIPGYEDVLQVELKPLPWNAQQAIIDKHSRVVNEGLKTSRIAADSIVAATVGFHEIVDDEGTTKECEGQTWKSLFVGAEKAAGRPLTPESEGQITSRIALVSFLGTARVVRLYGQWSEWSTSGAVAGKAERDLAGE